MRTLRSLLDSTRGRGSWASRGSMGEASDNQKSAKEPNRAELENLILSFRSRSREKKLRGIGRGGLFFFRFLVSTLYRPDTCGGDGNGDSAGGHQT